MEISKSLADGNNLSSFFFEFDDFLLFSFIAKDNLKGFNKNLSQMFEKK